jgi:transposase
MTVEKLLMEITAQGYRGGRTILAEFTRPYRKERRRTSDIRFETPPGQQAQVDWAELGYHTIGGKRYRLSLFIMVLGYSRMLFAEVVTDEKSATFLSCHEHAFSYFGGITEEILYDNAKVVALKRDREGIVFNESLLDFAGLYGFVPRVCRPYRPQTKGKVERSVRYIRDSFLEGESFADLTDMQTSLKAWLDNTANQRIHATTKRKPIELFLDEKLKDIRIPIVKNTLSEIGVISLEEKRFTFTDNPQIPVRSLASYEEAAL